MSNSPQTILILEPDRITAARLVRALKKIGPFTVSVMPSVRDACLHLMTTPQDVAFIPVTEGAKIVRSFRAVQPDLRLILMTPTAEYDVPKTYSGSVQAVLIKPLMDIELPAVLEQALDQPFQADNRPKSRIEQAFAAMNTDVLLETLNQVHLGRLVQSVVFAQGPGLLAFRGELSEKEAQSVALHVGSQWDGSMPSRVQFLHLPVRSGDMMLYTHQVMKHYYLTLVALPETPLNELRAQAAQIVVALKKIVLGQTAPLLSGLGETGVVDGRYCFAVAWRPVQPLPQSMLIPLRRVMDRIAAANACVLTHIDVQPKLVHLVVNCPPGRDSAWAAYLLKNGSEEKIQSQYGVTVQLWETGYYATESTDPLSEKEINILLDRVSMDP